MTRPEMTRLTLTRLKPDPFTRIDNSNMNTSQIASLIECSVPCLRNMNAKWVIDRMIGIAHTYQNKNDKAKKRESKNKKERAQKWETSSIIIQRFKSKVAHLGGLSRVLSLYPLLSITFSLTTLQPLKDLFEVYTHLCEVRLELRSAWFLTDT